MFQPEVPLETVRACELARLQPHAHPWQIVQHAPPLGEHPTEPAVNHPPPAAHAQGQAHHSRLARILARVHRAVASLRPFRPARA